MRTSSTPRVLMTLIFLTLALVTGAFAFGSSADSQEQAAAVPNFSRLTVRRLGVAFPVLNFLRGAPSSETKQFVVSNSGRGSTPLTANVGTPTGTGAGAFSIVSGGGLVGPLLPGAASTVTVKFQPVADGRAVASILVTSNGTRAATSRTVHLVGVARGPIPSSSATATATATATSTAATPTATATPGITDKNSANAPGVIINGTTVTVYVPQGSDDNSTTGTYQVVVENAASVLPTPSLIATDRVNSCSPAQSGEVVCSGQGGTVDLIPAAGGTPTILPLSGGAIPTLEYTTGDCAACGVLIDDVLNLGIVSSGLGFIPVDLTTSTVGSPIPVAGANNEAPGVVFGYDKANHLILSANYQITDSMFNQSSPGFQIINMSTPASPVLYEFAQGHAFFDANGRTCGPTPQDQTPSDSLPETTALDTSTRIAYVTFHTKSLCFNAPPDDIAMFDLTQANFNDTNHTWDTPSTLIQSITGTGLNGIDPISVESTNHLALVSAGDNNFGVLKLPTASGGNGASLAITDWVNALMPNDPDAVAWAGWHQPNGLATYVSPNTGKVTGVLMNNPGSPGNFTGSTYLAIVDMDGLLVATRDPSPGNGHKVDSSVDLVASGLVRFVKVK